MSLAFGCAAAQRGDPLGPVVTFHLADPQSGIIQLDGAALSVAQADDVEALPFRHPTKQEAELRIVRTPAAVVQIETISIEPYEHRCGPKDWEEEARSGRKCFDVSRLTVRLFFTQEGGRQIEELSREYLGWRLAIVQDREIIAAPLIREPIVGGKAVLSAAPAQRATWELLAKQTGRP